MGLIELRWFTAWWASSVIFTRY